MLTSLIFYFVFMQDTGTAVKYVDLAVARRVEPPELRTGPLEARGCQPGFDGSTPRPPEYCYPFPVVVKIMTYKPGAGYTKASLVVRVTNMGKGPVVLPVGTEMTVPQGDAAELTLGVYLENTTDRVGFGSAFSDAGIPASLAAILPGESIDYEIPVMIETLKAKPHPDRGATVPVVVDLGYYKVKRRGAGGFTFLIDTNHIPSNVFRIPYPE